MKFQKFINFIFCVLASCTTLIACDDDDSKVEELSAGEAMGGEEEVVAGEAMGGEEEVVAGEAMAGEEG
jgi:hypothetical protein